MINEIGIGILIALMIPNILFALSTKTLHHPQHSWIETIEQIGRFGSISSLVVDIPGLDVGYWFSYGKQLNFSIFFIFVAIYLVCWICYAKRETAVIILFLAIIPVILFLSQGILAGKPLLVISSLLFGFGHIGITTMMIIKKQRI